MRLSWNEIRIRAAQFAEAWADAAYEKSETQSFYNDFFEVFGVKRRKVARYEEHVRKLDNHAGYIDLFWPGVLLVEQKSAGKDLAGAFEQAGEYFDGLLDRDCPRYILVSDFQNFELFDLDEDDFYSFRLEDLPQNVEKFGFILGVQRRTFQDQDPVNFEATELMRRLHDALKASGYGSHEPSLGHWKNSWSGSCSACLRTTQVYLNPATSSSICWTREQVLMGPIWADGWRGSFRYWTHQKMNAN